MEKRFQMLRIIGVIFRVIGALIGVVTLIVVLSMVVSSLMQGPSYTEYGMAYTPMMLLGAWEAPGLSLSSSWCMAGSTPSRSLPSARVSSSLLHWRKTLVRPWYCCNRQRNRDSLLRLPDQRQPDLPEDNMILQII